MACDGNVTLQMAPPAYSDLGKQARDIFNKGYHFGLWKLDVKTKTNSGVEFNTSGNSNQDSGKVFASLETKYKLKEYGLTFTENWNTDNTLLTEVTLQDKLLEGLKLTLDCSFAPQSGYRFKKASIGASWRSRGRAKVSFFFRSNKTARVKAAYCHDYVHLNSDVNVDLAGPLVNAAAVFGYQGWLAGYQTSFDTQKSRVTANNFALAYSTGDFVIHTNV